MSTASYRIVIVGAGPAGLSAGAQAAKTGLPHIVLEASPRTANTVFHYQKNKFVMAEPAILPLRSHLPFEAGSRETVLAGWEKRCAGLGVNLRHDTRVVKISGERGAFEVHLESGEVLPTKFVILAVGLQGNLRKLGVPGDDLPRVHYQLDDATAYRDETIVVAGAGDAAIENALALSERNEVILLNRREEFPRARQSNADAIAAADQKDLVEVLFETHIERIQADSESGKALRVDIKTPDAPARIRCDRVIARLGAVPPRAFLESCGVAFSSDDPEAVPVLGSRYESNVPGLYIIGALAGYPLIKQALNQGHEVIEFLRGRKIAPVDEPLLRDKFKVLPAFQSVDDALRQIRRHVPLLAKLTPLQLREFMFDAKIHVPKPGEVIFRYNDYSDTFYCIITGEVRIPINPKDPGQIVTLRQGQFFGEMSLISGRRRSATVYAGSGQQCVLVEASRRSMLKLMNSVPVIKRMIDEAFIARAVRSAIAPEIAADDLEELVHSAELCDYSAGDILFREGDEADCIHLVRLGSVTLSRIIGGEETILSYVAAGNYIGEIGLLSGLTRNSTARAAVATETIRLDGTPFKDLLQRYPYLRHQIEAKLQQRLAQDAFMEARPQAGDIISFMVSQGLGEATDVLLIDESLCIACDNCEKACTETHKGTSRLKREAGASFASVHVPTSCRHCEHPHCMKDCPPDAIHRAPNGEVYIADNCIGCGNCERNCPYGVIQMAAPQRRKPGLLWWLLFGFGPGPGRAAAPVPEAEKKAVKCDMCQDLKGGPACVRACPTGAAFRVSPEEFMRIALQG